MEKKRIQKLAGINEGTNFFNGEFQLERFNDDHDEASDGNWCYDGDVTKLEELANEMYAYIRKLGDISGTYILNDARFKTKTQAILKKAQSL